MSLISDLASPGPRLVVVMLGAGLAGGFANFLDTRLEKERPGNEMWWHFTRCCVLGLIGSFCVPLFLNVIQSDIIEKAKSSGTLLLVFAGFCLLAAFYSRRFLDSVAERALKLAQKNESDVKQVGEEVKKVVDAGAEPPASVVQSPMVASPSKDDLMVDDKNHKILAALAGKKYTFRSAAGIAAEAKIDEDEVVLKLHWLVQQGLVGRTSATSGPRWFITARGRLCTKRPDPLSSTSQP